MIRQFENASPTGALSYRSVLFPAALMALLLVVVLAIEVVLSVHTRRVIAPANTRIVQLLRLQRANLALQQELIESMSDGAGLTVADRVRLSGELEAILNLQSQLTANSPEEVAQARDALSDLNLHPKEALMLALSRTRTAIERESQAHQQAIAAIDRASVLKLRIGLLSLGLFAIGAVLLLYHLLRRIVRPLNHLAYLMTLLAHRDFSGAPAEAVDPLLRPLTENYNAMVSRLSLLEREHESREQDLKAQIEHATRTLLEQQYNLASTEKLAAVGETMAQIAHELRNPLAGIKAACSNLRQDLSQAQEPGEYVERIDAVAGEIDRIITVLNAMLDQSRHQPEALREITVARAIEDLFTLLRYQIPPHIRLEHDIPADLKFRLPEAMLLQALLNLILNARQAIGDRPGVIAIEARVRAGMLILRVSDDGPGFPEDMLRSGLRAFATTRLGGTGLGLPMVERFARDLGGGIRLANRQPHGACVTLEIPGGTGNV
ncbi:MAG: HAMP domain-containing histidine kinase [Halioglobus sp.]|nr:HAMP domain-containing histidine kinase [Halioglobus sp.]